MDFFLDHWGNIFSVIGVVVSVVGLAWAIREARRARSAAQAAERATVETRASIGHRLAATDLERGIGLIQRLKSLHREGHWDAALEQYQTLRAIISDIIARYSELELEVRERLNRARTSLSEMEKSVEHVLQGREDADPASLNGQLNEIQIDLESIVSAMEFDE